MLASDLEVAGPHHVRQHSFMEIDLEVFSMVILSLLLIQDFLAKECAQVLVDCLED